MTPPPPILARQIRTNCSVVRHLVVRSNALTLDWLESTPDYTEAENVQTILFCLHFFLFFIHVFNYIISQALLFCVLYMMYKMWRRTNHKSANSCQGSKLKNQIYFYVHQNKSAVLIYSRIYKQRSRNCSCSLESAFEHNEDVTLTSWYGAVHVCSYHLYRQQYLSKYIDAEQKSNKPKPAPKIHLK